MQHLCGCVALPPAGCGCVCVTSACLLRRRTLMCGSSMNCSRCVSLENPRLNDAFNHQ